MSSESRAPTNWIDARCRSIDLFFFFFTLRRHQVAKAWSAIGVRKGICITSCASSTIRLSCGRGRKSSETPLQDANPSSSFRRCAKGACACAKLSLEKFNWKGENFLYGIGEAVLTTVVKKADFWFKNFGWRRFCHLLMCRWKNGSWLFWFTISRDAISHQASAVKSRRTSQN